MDTLTRQTIYQDFSQPKAIEGIFPLIQTAIIRYTRSTRILEKFSARTNTVGTFHFTLDGIKHNKATINRFFLAYIAMRLLIALHEQTAFSLLKKMSDNHRAMVHQYDNVAAKSTSYAVRMDCLTYARYHFTEWLRLMQVKYDYPIPR